MALVPIFIRKEFMFIDFKKINQKCTKNTAGSKSFGNKSKNRDIEGDEAEEPSRQENIMETISEVGPSHTCPNSGQIFLFSEQNMRAYPLGSPKTQHYLKSECYAKHKFFPSDQDLRSALEIVTHAEETDPS